MARRNFTREFKTSAARLVTEQAYTVPQAAKSLGVDPGSIRDWVKKFAPTHGTTTPPTVEASLRHEVERLRQENRRLLMEREILKKATTFFAKEQP